MDSHLSGTQTESDHFPEQQQDTGFEQEAMLADEEDGLALPNSLDNLCYRDSDMADPDCRVRATDESKLASPALQGLIDLSLPVNRIKIPT